MGKAKAKLTPAEKAQRRLHTIKHLKQYSALYAMMILPLLYFIIFKYVPMFGNILAFRRYRPGQGMFGTEWTLRYFERFLKDPAFWRAFRNTLVVSLENLVINFPLPIIFAILLNEVRNKHLKKGCADHLLHAALYLHGGRYRHHERDSFSQHRPAEQPSAQCLRHDPHLLHERARLGSARCTSCRNPGSTPAGPPSSIWPLSPASAAICMKPLRWMALPACSRSST